MIQRLNFSGVLNNLSLGNVGFNIVRELYRRKVQCSLFLKGRPDLSAYKIDPQFGAWLEQSINNRYKRVDRKVPTLNIWHLRDSETRLSDKQVTLSFHETSSPTESEVNIANQQDHTFFTSSWTVDNFQTYGANNVSFVPLGMDEDFQPAVKRQVSNDITHWILVGKWEDLRKLTTYKIQSWIRRYGGNPKHQLTLCVENPFYKPEDMQQLYQRAFGGNRPFNVNVLPRLKTNVEMSQLYSSCDVDLSGFSRAEGWNLPSFMATALGKWSIVSNCSAHKDWATKDNAILVEPTGLVKAVDGHFFVENAEFSSGNMFDFKGEDFDLALQKAEKKAKTANPAGRKLAEEMTYKRTVDEILAVVEKI